MCYILTEYKQQPLKQNFLILKLDFMYKYNATL